MKKFIVLAVGLLMFLAVDAAPTYDVGQQKTDQVLLMQQTDGSQMVVDFVYEDYPVVTIATEPLTEDYAIYEAPPIDVYSHVFDFTMPVSRLCSHRSNEFKPNIYTGWRGVNSNPPSKYDMA